MFYRWVLRHRFAADLGEAAERMRRLLVDLLEVSRLESGTLRIVTRTHDIGALLE